MKTHSLSNAPATWSAATAGQRLVATLKRLASDDQALRNIFSHTFTDQLQTDLAQLPQRPLTPLSGALISVKALLDVQGQVTHGGTRFLAGHAPASADAPAVARLRQAGGLLLGHTHMTELAYSGLGLNPHYGTADNPLWPGCTPGGSTSGGAVSVATGLADIAIGSDTGGSLRIPAAFCGITGFKPTQASVPREGTLPLSDTVDSIGPMAQDVQGCALAWQTMAGLPVAALQQEQPTLALHVARNFGFNDLDPLVAAGFEQLLAELNQQAPEIPEITEITDAPLGFLDDYHQLEPWKLTSVECRAHFEEAFQQQAGQFDPRVHSRMARADELSAVQYRQAFNQRQRFVRSMTEGLMGKVLLMPTVAILPPTFIELEDDAVFAAKNLMALRNTTLANMGDACSLALPYRFRGKWLSVMLVSATGTDVALLQLGARLEQIIAGLGG